MIKLEIVSSIASTIGNDVINGWILDASAGRGKAEFRVASPWGYKLIEVENFELTEEMHPDAEQFRFGGQLGRFAVAGLYYTLEAQGEIDIYADAEDEVEVLPLLKRNQMMTPLEFAFGYPGMMDSPG